MQLPLLLILLTLFASPLFAAEFDIYQSDFHPLQLAIVLDDDALSHDDQQLLYRVMANDLNHCQSFKTIDPMAFIATPKSLAEGIDYGDWTLIGADILAYGQLTREADGLRMILHVYDSFRSKQLAMVEVAGDGEHLRLLAHQAANQVYHAALGIPGYFTSHLLYVSKHGDSSDLIYMDQDGANQQVVGHNFTLLLSPDWAPDGKTVALNTYVGNRPRLEFFDLQRGTRTTFGEFKGLNSTPEFSPDGQFVAATLSYKGDSDIFIYNVQRKRWRQLTHNRAIDTAPTWSPDGKWIAFVSNRSGKPQIYRKPVAGGPVQLVSTEGDYNTSPSWSPTGDRIAMISLKNWSFAVATVRPDGSDIRYLATGKRVESPTWSPNGQMIIFSAEEQRVRRLYQVPSWGGTAEPITPATIDASDPAWSRR